MWSMKVRWIRSLPAVLQGLVVALLSFAPLVAAAQDGSGEGLSGPAVEASPAAESAPAARTATDARSGGVTDTNYAMRLRELEDRVNELKEDIFRTKSRLFLLREQILQQDIGGSRLVVLHRDRLSATYTHVRAQFYLDGNLIWQASEGDEGLTGRAECFSGSILPGPHNLSVEYELRGNDFGVFAYMSGYTFTSRSSHAFTVEDGQTIEIGVEPFERGGANEALEERPSVRFDVEVYATDASTVAEGSDEDR